MASYIARCPRTERLTDNGQLTPEHTAKPSSHTFPVQHTHGANVLRNFAIQTDQGVVLIEQFHLWISMEKPMGARRNACSWCQTASAASLAIFVQGDLMLSWIYAWDLWGGSGSLFLSSPIHLTHCLKNPSDQ